MLQYLEGNRFEGSFVRAEMLPPAKLKIEGENENYVDAYVQVDERR